jgi:CspA family cold shock protein
MLGGVEPILRDEWVVCSECGERFVFRVREQRALASRGELIQAPEACPLCILGKPAGGRHSGRVKWYSPRRGYGLIQSSDGREVRFHRDSVYWNGPMHLTEGSWVAFQVRWTPRGPSAVAVWHPEDRPS